MNNSEERKKYNRIWARKKRQEIKQNPEKYAEYRRKQNEYVRKMRERITPEEKKKRILYNLKWRQENRERDKQNKRNHRNRLRKEIIKAYGGKCNCCGEEKIEFLGIDHIGGGGNKHRKSLGKSGYHFYYWLRKNNFPKGFRILCHNCNQSFGHYGYCPHNKSIE